MTRIIFFRRGGIFYGFEEVGHSGFDDVGFDVLCAAISSMTMLVINTIEVALETDVQYVVDEIRTKISVTSLEALPDYSDDEKQQYAVSNVFKGYYLQLKDMQEEYYENLSVEIRDDEDVV